MWPTDAQALVTRQEELAAQEPEPWVPGGGTLLVGGCWASFPQGVSGPGAEGDPAWTAAVALRGGRVVAERVSTGRAGAPYTPGLLALRLGALLESAVRALPALPDVLLLDGTGRDHPRRAGLAVHVGAELGLPTVGVTHRPLVAEGEWPVDERGATSALRIGDEVVARWVRTRAGTRPLVVHPGWRLDLDTAVRLVLTTSSHRTPEPLRRARRAAREQRAADGAGS